MSHADFGEGAERVVRAVIFSTYPPRACEIGAQLNRLGDFRQEGNER